MNGIKKFESDLAQLEQIILALQIGVSELDCVDPSNEKDFSAVVSEVNNSLRRVLKEADLQADRVALLNRLNGTRDLNEEVEDTPTDQIGFDIPLVLHGMPLEDTKLKPIKYDNSVSIADYESITFNVEVVEEGESEFSIKTQDLLALQKSSEGEDPRNSRKSILLGSIRDLNRQKRRVWVGQKLSKNELLFAIEGGSGFFAVSVWGNPNDRTQAPDTRKNATEPAGHSQ